MNKFWVVLLAGVIAFNAIYIGKAFAQNQTGNYSTFTVSADQLIFQALNMIIAVAALLKTFSDRGILSRRIGTVAVVASDTAVATRDNRQFIKDGIQNTQETVALISPDANKYANEKLAPIADKVSSELGKYEQKVNVFTRIGGEIGRNKHSEAIEDIKGQIPDEIIPGG